jgi:uncharacterized protein GlcG (DUF336 family)
MSRLTTRAIGTAILASGLSVVAASAQPLTQHNVSIAMARQIIEGAIAHCNRPGELLTVTIAVVDRAGEPVMQVRGDTASPHNWELAFRKAYTARTYRRSTIDWRDTTMPGMIAEGQRMNTHLIPLGGGVPIMMGDEPLGAVGISGAEGGQPADTACAEAGVAAIADQLQ